MSHGPVRSAPRRIALASLVVAASLASAATAGAAPTGLEVVTDGLANPRGITFGPGGHLYVAEAGSGGSGACKAAPEGEGEVCLGPTGAITKVDVSDGDKKKIVEGLPSLAAPTGPNAGAEATGPHDVSFKNGRAYFTVGLGASPTVRDELGADAAQLGSLFRINRAGHVVLVADLAAFEAKANPDAAQPGSEVDSNPFSVDATRGPALVTDAGGNALLRVEADGDVEVLAVFGFGETAAPPFLGLPAGTKIPYQAVPTGIARAQDGAAYVGQLTGFPFPVGAANVFRVADGDTSVLEDGFTNIVDVATGPDGSLYVLQIAAEGLLAESTAGKLIHIAHDGTRHELAAGQLTRPTGVAVAGNGDVYVANNGTSGSAGEIVRIPAAGGDDGDDD